MKRSCRTSISLSYSIIIIKICHIVDHFKMVGLEGVTLGICIFLYMHLHGITTQFGKLNILKYNFKNHKGLYDANK